MADKQRVRVGVVAGDPLRSVGLETILDEFVGLAPVGLALDEVGPEAKLSAVLIDNSCVYNLAEALARLRRQLPTVPIVVMGDSLDPGHIQGVIAAGAKGYLLEAASEAEIRMAMEVVLDGSVWAPRKVMARLIEAGGVAPAAGVNAARVTDRMTPREAEVLQLLLAGKSNRQIAESMSIDEVTVKAHLGRMLRKAGVKNRIELTLKALEEQTAPDSASGI